ncbi:MAG: hypothetical protein C4516_01800 [Oxalobacter sp.]|nr:MAG: hypothetical protein C4516_01800 [Oxalobacter sp.]
MFFFVYFVKPASEREENGVSSFISCREIYSDPNFQFAVFIKLTLTLFIHLLASGKAGSE